MLESFEGALLNYSYAGLFLASFLAATILPFGSEGIVTLLVSRGSEIFTVILIASIGNFLGSCTNYYIGLKGRGHIERYIRIKPDEIKKAEDYFSKYGPYILLFAWFPVIGDALTVVSGLLKLRFVTFSIFVFTGKFVRYLVWAYLPIPALFERILILFE